MKYCKEYQNKRVEIIDDLMVFRPRLLQDAEHSRQQYEQQGMASWFKQPQLLDSAFR